MFDISNELSTTQDGLVFLLVRFLLESSLPPVNERINLNIGFKFEVRYVLSLGSMTIPSGNNNLSVVDLESGNYIIRMRSADKAGTARFVIVR